MKLHHIALWTQRLEEMKDFYVSWFGGCAGEKYTNAAKGFNSYFVSFGDGATLEIMSRTDITKVCSCERLGLCHLAFGAASKEEVVDLTERLRAEGYTIAGEPRTTGDGMFESVVLDPDGNRIEIVF